MTKVWEPMLARLATERYPRLVAHAMMLVGSRADAEDLVQEALVATFVGSRTFDGIAHAERYVRQAIVTKFVDRYRKLDRERHLWRRASASSDGTVHDHAPGVGAATDLGTALRALPPRQRACVALRYLDDLSIAQTAHLLGISEGSVKRYVADGLAALSPLVDGGDDEDEAEWLILEPRGGGER